MGNNITCRRLDALTGSLGVGQVLAHCFLVLLGPPSISAVSLLGEEEPGKLILAEVLQRWGLGGSAEVDAVGVSCLPAPPPPWYSGIWYLFLERGLSFSTLRAPEGS